MTKRILILTATVLFVFAALFGCSANESANQNAASNDTQILEETANKDLAATDEVVEISQGNLTYKIVDTGQDKCYDNSSELSLFPNVDMSFYGQDAQYLGYQPSYTLSDDAKTVYDNVTELTWQRSPNTTNTIPEYSDKLTYDEALDVPDELNAMAYGGYTDWRLPTIKELYSLILFSGKDPSGYAGTDTSVLTPFIDTDYFLFSYGEASSGERIIDSQYFSATTFVDISGGRESQKQFGVNFADGRIKGYDLITPMGDKLFYVMCVRGNTSYGINSYADNGDSTITDSATGLMWAQKDSQISMDWEETLAWVQSQNNANYLGYSDWRLPNVKELNSIVDYNNSPDYNGYPAIDVDYFQCTQITNEAGEDDFAYYWTSTTHVGYLDDRANNIAGSAAYIPFGTALGYMRNSWVNVHGSGAQRSTPKTDDNFSRYSSVTYQGILGYYFGPQGDAVRADNYIRLVRDAN